MGFFGQLILFVPSEIREPLPIARRLIWALETDELEIPAKHGRASSGLIHCVSTWDKPDRSWEIWRENPASSQDNQEMLDCEFVEGPLSMEHLDTLMPQGGRMLIGLGLSELARPLCEAARRLPREVMGDFVLGSRASITLGWHDIIDGYDDPFLVDRAHLSVSLEGPLSPRDWEAARQLILDLPQLAAFRAPLEEIAGPMKAWVKWS